MKKINLKSIDIALSFMALHLFIVNSKLLYGINPDKFVKEGYIFSFLNITDEYTVLSMIAAVSYSIITVIMIRALRTNGYYIYFLLAYAVLDGLVNFIYYWQPENYALWGSLFYAFYTAWLIFSIGINANQKNRQKAKSIPESVIQMLELGMTKKEISDKLGLTIIDINKILDKK